MKFLQNYGIRLDFKSNDKDDLKNQRKMAFKVEIFQTHYVMMPLFSVFQCAVDCEHLTFNKSVRQAIFSPLLCSSEKVTVWIDWLCKSGKVTGPTKPLQIRPTSNIFSFAVLFRKSHSLDRLTLQEQKSNRFCSTNIKPSRQAILSPRSELRKTHSTDPLSAGTWA